MTKRFTHLIACLLTVLIAARLAADSVDVKGGARIVGKVIKVDDGAVVVETTYADKITIKQAEVVAINTDAPIAVRLIGEDLDQMKKRLIQFALERYWRSSMPAQSQASVPPAPA